MSVMMMDASCLNCRTRVGWSGRVTDRPPCPRCGYVVPRAELEADAAQLAEMQRLTDLHPKDATAAELRLQRRMAGLNLGQVARQLGVTVVTTSRWETGDERPTPEQCDRLADLYQCGPRTPSPAPGENPPPPNA